LRRWLLSEILLVVWFTLALSALGKVAGQESAAQQANAQALAQQRAEQQRAWWLGGALVVVGVVGWIVMNDGDR
jgi:hypothetical protein